MAITALPPSAVRLLGSSVAITTPPDVVKELLENAIDAQATFVEITVSPDALSELKVRDNGIGISLDDAQVLARQAHTSKLGNFEELPRKGGRTLGFRGEALASITSMADIVVTTRTAGDPVASKFKVSSGTGGIDGDVRPVAAPVGTMIRVQSLFRNLPVRRQQWEKQGQKSITRMKELLHTYALARPCIKVHLKVHGTSRPAYAYNPASAASVREAVLQLFGGDVASNCTETRLGVDLSPSLGSNHDPSTAPHVTLQAFFPKVGCRASAIASRGSFISVDARPISARHGFGKKIAKVFKSHLKVNGVADRSKVTNPFFHLEIRCAPGVYDPNITPLKDEVLFAEEAMILEEFDRLCARAFSVETDLVRHIIEEGEESADCPQTTMERNEREGNRRLHLMPGLLSKFDAQPGNASESQLRLEPVVTRPSLMDDISDCLGSSSTPPLPEAASSDMNPMRSMKSTEAHPQETFAGQSQKPLAKVNVRLQSSAVNMSRTSSNSTDESEVDNIAEIEMPCPVAVQPTPAPRRKSLVMSRSTLGQHQIENSLQAAPEPDFDIAIDDTATSPGRLELCTMNPITYPEGAVRVPLQELRESDLNVRVAGYRDYRRSPIIVQPQHAAQTEPRLPLARGPIKEIGTTNVVGASTTDHQPRPPRLRNSRPALTASSGPTRPDLSHVDAPTPPSSDPRRRITARNPDATPQQSERRPVTPPGSTGEIYHRIQSFQDHTIGPQATESSRNVKRRQLHLDLNGRLLTGLPDQTHSEHELGNPDFPHQSCDRDIDLACAPNSNITIPYSHALRSRLMQTPAPIQHEISGEKNMTCPRAGKIAYGVGQAVPETHVKRKYQAEEGDGSQQSCSGTIEDHSLHIVKRRRSSALLGKPKRMPSTNLPLEVLPQGESTHQLSTVVSLQLWQVKHLIEQLGVVETKHPVVEEGTNLWINNIHEVEEVEVQLRDTINAWKTSIGHQGDIKYTLTRPAKGKGKA